MKKEIIYLLISGYENMDDATSSGQQMINRIQTEGIDDKTATRYDQLTFLTQKNISVSINQEFFISVLEKRMNSVTRGSL
jgi:hypothetical protein